MTTATDHLTTQDDDALEALFHSHDADHYYSAAAGDWLCLICGTCTDFCSALNLEQPTGTQEQRDAATYAAFLGEPTTAHVVMCSTCRNIGGSDWLGKANSDASWHNTMTGHVVTVLSADEG